MKTKQRFVLSIVLLQIILVFMAMLITDGLVGVVSAAEGDSVVDPATAMILGLSAAIAISGSTLAAGMVIKTVGTAAISALTENESVFFKAFLVIALGEALAIYGLIVAILLWIKIPAF